MDQRIASYSVLSATKLLPETHGAQPVPAIRTNFCKKSTTNTSNETSHPRVFSEPEEQIEQSLDWKNTGEEAETNSRKDLILPNEHSSTAANYAESLQSLPGDSLENHDVSSSPPPQLSTPSKTGSADQILGSPEIQESSTEINNSGNTPPSQVKANTQSTRSKITSEIGTLCCWALRGINTKLGQGIDFAKKHPIKSAVMTAGGAGLLALCIALPPVGIPLAIALGGGSYAYSKYQKFKTENEASKGEAVQDTISK